MYMAELESWGRWLIHFEWTGGKIVPQELIYILCDRSTGCKKVCDSDDFP